MSPPHAKDVEEAAARLRGLVHRTPIVTSRQLDELSGASFFFKCENLQKVGAFKARGALNAVLQLTEDAAKRGVVTHSSGNHGQAIAFAARTRGILATVVIPEGASRVKVAAVEAYGARIVFSAPTSAGRAAAAAAIVAETGGTMVHPFDDAAVIAGQGTAALELLEDVGVLDAVVAPIGGGGLLSGTALAVKGACSVLGAEPEQADDAARSLAEGRIVTRDAPQTIADGLRSAAIGHLNFAILRAHCASILTVSEAEIVTAMRLVWERLKLVVEPSAAVAVAAALRHRDLFSGKRVGVILSGGNVDLGALPFGRPVPDARPAGVTD